MIHAEVIGDPIAHSRSPAIHRFWLEALGLEGEYRATQVAPGGLAVYFADRRGDPGWRGCNVTAPHKESVADFLDEVGAEAKKIGAVNCIHREGDRLVGLNTDVDGLAEALAGAELAGAKIAVIGAGGGARAAVHLAVRSQVRSIAIIARDSAKATSLAGLGSARTEIRILPFERSREAIAGAAAVVNATPMGLAGADEMPAPTLASLDEAAPGCVALDMVYVPLDTPFLTAARAAGLIPVDGLAMLIGQARRAFRLFFGVTPPADRDAELRELLTRK
ncbi:shikimate dehydrogenase [Sphingosinicella sp. CPCC 101087]|uniref:shikimate dehydrogenase family protein n=1 Tax=Sphingosinicella sp. CPCC 101087 TaxID=2497754 RepID=UPI00101E082C|nr:shikimate dehydrogenase [Sphingosinicella sp. CPCC 101087]